MSQLPCLQAIEVDFKWRLKNYCEEHGLDALKYPDIKATIFEQTWGSTALGFGGVGGQAITSAWTTVIWDDVSYIFAVYFGGGFAYLIENPNDEFKNDVFHNHQVVEVGKRGKYKRIACAEG